MINKARQKARVTKMLRRKYDSEIRYRKIRLKMHFEFKVGIRWNAISFMSLGSITITRLDFQQSFLTTLHGFQCNFNTINYSYFASLAQCELYLCISELLALVQSCQVNCKNDYGLWILRYAWISHSWVGQLWVPISSPPCWHTWTAPQHAHASWHLSW